MEVERLEYSCMSAGMKFEASRNVYFMIAILF